MRHAVGASRAWWYFRRPLPRTKSHVVSRRALSHRRSNRDGVRGPVRFSERTNFRRSTAAYVSPALSQKAWELSARIPLQRVPTSACTLHRVLVAAAAMHTSFSLGKYFSWQCVSPANPACGVGPQPWPATARLIRCAIFFCFRGGAAACTEHKTGKSCPRGSNRAIVDPGDGTCRVVRAA